MVTVAQRLDRSLDDEVGSAEVGLADAEIDDVAALRRQRIGARQHGKGVFLAEAVEHGYGSEHACSILTATALPPLLSRPAFGPSIHVLPLHFPATSQT